MFIDKPAKEIRAPEERNIYITQLTFRSYGAAGCWPSRFYKHQAPTELLFLFLLMLHNSSATDWHIHEHFGALAGAAIDF